MTTDPRPTRTRTALIEAATSILLTDSPATPSISNLVALAGISRPTFYQHFADPQDLIRTTALTRLQENFYTLQDPPAENLKDLASATITALLSRLQEDATFYRNALTIAGDASLFASLNTFLSQRFLTRPHARQTLSSITALTSTEEQEEYSRFIAAGLSWAAIRWLGTDFTGPNSIPTMSQRLTTTLLTSLHQGN